MADTWSAEENSAIVDAYFWMLSEETAGRPFVKSEVRRSLIAGKLSRRSEGAIERKFQNISAVLDQYDLGFVDGYKPLRNYQSDLRSVVLDKLEALGVNLKQ